MARHDQYRAGGMAYDILSRASDQHMFEAGYPMRGRNDHVGTLFERFSANLLTSMSDLKRRSYLDSFPISLCKQDLHLLAGGLFAPLHKLRKVITRVFVARNVVVQRN